MTKGIDKKKQNENIYIGSNVDLQVAKLLVRIGDLKKKGKFF